VTRQAAVSKERELAGHEFHCRRFEMRFFEALLSMRVGLSRFFEALFRMRLEPNPQL